MDLKREGHISPLYKLCSICPKEPVVGAIDSGGPPYAAFLNIMTCIPQNPQRVLRELTLKQPGIRALHIQYVIIQRHK